MFKLADDEFDKAYATLLEKLSASKVVEDLGENAILLCWEDFNVGCHRRMVAEWIESECGLIIPEYGHERHESLPYSEQPNKTKVTSRQGTLSWND
jgi:hypothetical protein